VSFGGYEFDLDQEPERIQVNCRAKSNVHLHMARTLKFIPALAILGVFSLRLTSQSTAAPIPRALIEKAIALRNSDKILPRYTYFELKITQNRTPKGKLLVDDSTLYEDTWIGDLAYARVVEVKGKPLKGKALAGEQARYDKAVADHGGLVALPAKVKHAYLLDTSLRLESLLTPAYVVSELRQVTLAGSVTHVVDCTPAASADVTHPVATRHATLWITDSGVILRETYEVVADEPDKMRGSHGQNDFQLIDGNLLPQHSFFHLNAPNGNTGDFEDTYSRYRRFNVSSRIVSATESSSDRPSSTSP
jgi:hypothetical protein